MTDPTPTAAVDAAPRCYRHPDRITYVSCQRCGRPICPDCQTVAAVGVQCPECIAEGRATAPRRAPGFVRALRPSGRPIVTYVLIGLCVLVYGAQWLSGTGVATEFAMYAPLITTEPWRLLTSAFLHSQSLPLVHLLFNMYALYIFGPTLEGFLGRWRFAVLYLLAAVGGNVAMVVDYQVQLLAGVSLQQAASLSLGASGAIFGLMGALLLMRKAMGIPFQQIVVVVVLNLAIGFFVPNIAWQAHLGGLIVGAVVGVIYVRTRRRELQRAQVAGLIGVGVALALVCVACVVTAPSFSYA